MRGEQSAQFWVMGGEFGEIQAHIGHEGFALKCTVRPFLPKIAAGGTAQFTINRGNHFFSSV